MNIRKYYPGSVLSLVFLFLFFHAGDSLSFDEQKYPEAKIKIAYLFNFLRFIEWPEEQGKKTHICLFGTTEEYHSASESLKHQTIDNESIVIREYSDTSGLGNLDSCQIIFVTTRANHMQKIIANTLSSKNVLIVGESKGFIQHGGMINFIKRENTIRFEINLDAINRTDLVIPSKVLRIADRVISEEDDE